MHEEKSSALFRASAEFIPGGVNSPVRAYRSVNRIPRFIEKAKGSKIHDVDGNEYIDYVCSWGPAIMGHAHESVLKAVRDAVENGLSFGAPTEKELKLARLVNAIMPHIESLRLVNSGTEAVMSAIRLARGYTGKNRIIKFRGCYHGHSDAMLVKAGSGGINDLYAKVSLIESIQNAGFEVNQELIDFYTAFAPNRAAVSITAQNWNLPEPPVKNYGDELIENAKNFSDTAVIVISRLAGEGHNDIPQDMAACEIYTDNSEDYRDWNEGDHYLQLNNTEKDMVRLVCDNFENVVVVYNGAYAFELGFVEEYDSIKGLIWAPGPGNVGFTALGEILNGSVNPSGRTNDTFVYDMKTTPYWHNAEKRDYTNMLHMMVEGMNAGVPTNYAPSFINYVENIYVGYKFYETAYTEALRYAEEQASAKSAEDAKEEG